MILPHQQISPAAEVVQLVWRDLHNSSLRQDSVEELAVYAACRVLIISLLYSGRKVPGRSGSGCIQVRYPVPITRSRCQEARRGP